MATTRSLGKGKVGRTVPATAPHVYGPPVVVEVKVTIKALAFQEADGGYSVGTAGHPAAIQFQSGSGRWAMFEQAAGPVLGVIEDATFERNTGTLQRGDALILYTDGVIETRHHDLTVGVDRMLGIAERLISRGFHGGAARLCASAKAGETDDRAVVMVWRD